MCRVSDISLVFLSAFLLSFLAISRHGQLVGTTVCNQSRFVISQDENDEISALSSAKLSSEKSDVGERERPERPSKAAPGIIDAVPRSKSSTSSPISSADESSRVPSPRWAVITVVNAAVLDFFTSWWLSIVRRTDLLDDAQAAGGTRTSTEVFAIVISADAQTGLLDLRRRFLSTPEGKALGPDRAFRIVDGLKLLSAVAAGERENTVESSLVSGSPLSASSEAGRSQVQRLLPKGWSGLASKGGTRTTTSSEQVDFGERGFAKLTSTRPAFIGKFLQAGYAVLYADVDVIFLRHNLLQEVVRGAEPTRIGEDTMTSSPPDLNREGDETRGGPRHQIFFVKDIWPPSPRWAPCSCIIAVPKATDQVYSLLQKWQAGFAFDPSGTQNDQHILLWVTKAKESGKKGFERLADGWRGVIGELDVYSFPPGRVWGDGENARRPKPLAEEDRPVDGGAGDTDGSVNDRFVGGGPGPFWLHANWRIGHEAKRDLLSRWGANFTILEEKPD